jgi:predicted PurR-regulated permease PerM
MNRKFFKTFPAWAGWVFLLAAALLKLDWILIFFGKILFILRPLFVGLGVAYVLNGPFEFFARSYGRMARRGRTAARAVSLATVYLLFLLVMLIVFGVLIPQVRGASRGFTKTCPSTASAWAR